MKLFDVIQKKKKKKGNFVYLIMKNVAWGCQMLVPMHAPYCDACKILPKYGKCWLMNATLYR
jgi:hypothetical protein